MAGRKIGALWRKKDKQGKTFFSGTIELIAGVKTSIVCFQKEEKASSKPNQPAYEIYLSQQKSQQEPKVEVIKVKSEERD